MDGVVTVSDEVDARAGESVAAEAMLRRPKVLAADASLAEVRAELDDDHVHMALLTRGSRLLGTLVSSDLPASACDELPALPFARLEGRTVLPTERIAGVRERLLAAGTRRLAVVGTDGSLLGLMCLKRRRHGFCSDADVEARAAE